MVIEIMLKMQIYMDHGKQSSHIFSTWKNKIVMTVSIAANDTNGDRKSEAFFDQSRVDIKDLRTNP